MYSKGEVTIGGKSRPVYFGINTAVFICEQLNISLAEYSTRFSLGGLQKGTGREMRMMLYAGLISGAEQSNQPVDFTEKQVGYWMDEFEVDELTKVFNIISSGNPPPAADGEKKTEVNP